MSKIKSIKWIFVGANHIRTGWRALLFVVCWMALYTAVGLPSHHLLHVDKGHEVPLHVASVGEALQLIATLGATWVMSKVERRNIFAYGLTGPRFLAWCVRGWLIGLAAVSLMILSLWGLGCWHFDGIHTHGSSAVLYAILWGVLFSAVAFSEECTFRGYLFVTLSRDVNVWPAAVCLSMLFAAVHLSGSGENWFGIFALFLTGLMFSFIVWRTKSLAAAFGLHASWDWAQSYLYGVADSGNQIHGYLLKSHMSGSELLSGGSVGPEGSILVIPVMLLIAVTVHLTTDPGIRLTNAFHPRRIRFAH